MFPQGPPAEGSTPLGGFSAEDEGPPVESDAMCFVDFGPLFGQEMQKVLRHRMPGMFCELMFWQDEYRF